jgi:exodeoxyribonuclease VII small subunit
MTAQKPVEELTFEEALEELEQLTTRVSSGSITLRESVASYERGMALAKRCEAEIAEAKARIAAIQPSADENHSDDVF